MALWLRWGLIGMSLFWKHYPAFVKGAESVYYWWYMWLREVEGYDPHHKLYAEFGDVMGMSFNEWFGEHEEYLFDDGLPPMVSWIESDQDLSEAKQQDRLVLSIDRTCGRKELVALLDEILQNELTGGSGRRTHEEECGNARYKPYQRPDCQSLMRTYELHIYMKEHPCASNVEVAQALGIIGKGRVFAADTMRAGEVVWREKRRAERLIANVAEGRFPCFD